MRINHDPWRQHPGYSVLTTVHRNAFGSASNADISSLFQLRSCHGTYKYAIFTQPSISITSPPIGPPISLLIVCPGEAARQDEFCEKLRTSQRLTATCREQLTRLQMT